METNNPEYAVVLNQLALLYIQMNKIDQVEPLLQKASTIYKKKFTEENAAFAKVQNDLGNFYRLQARYAEAETVLSKALAIRQRTLGENHPDYVKSMESLGILYWKRGDLGKAYPLLSGAANKSLEFIYKYFPPMSEAEKQSIGIFFNRGFNGFIIMRLKQARKIPRCLPMFIITRSRPKRCC
ncbi:MAG: tetratricopeptide repeat protein [Flammeovirgaceae bacterium]|nr:tetratricopeptide repeat protein [Flammeovirgaceae bacterium]